MNPLEKLLIRMGGYPPRAVEADSPDDREPLIKLGWSVMLAAFVAAANWSTAGWVYSKGTPSPIRFAVVATCALIGGGIVLAVDRGFVYFSDTTVKSSKGMVIAYTAIRVIFILLVSSITAQAVMPIIMGKELAAHALYMTERSEAERLTKLNSQYDLTSRKNEVTATNIEVKRLEDAASTLPPGIQQMIAAAHACWAEYNTRKIALRSDGSAEAGIAEQLEWKATECYHDSKTATAEADAYRKLTQARLNDTVIAQSQAAAELSGANTAIEQKMEHASRIETDAISPQSSIVLSTLLMSSPGALMKWAIISLTLLFLELMPLVQKFLAGQSTIGRRIGTGWAIKKLQFGEQLARANYVAAAADAIAEVSRRGVTDAAATPEVRIAFAHVFAANLAAYAPTQAVESMMNEFAARQYDIDQFMHHFPRYASVIALAWSKAIRETTEILTGGIRRKTIPFDQQPSS